MAILLTRYEIIVECDNCNTQSSFFGAGPYTVKENAIKDKWNIYNINNNEKWFCANCKPDIGKCLNHNYIRQSQVD